MVVSIAPTGGKCFGMALRWLNYGSGLPGSESADVFLNKNGYAENFSLQTGASTMMGEGSFPIFSRYAPV